MEDPFAHTQDYHVEDDSDVDVIDSSDEEREENELLVLHTKDGKDVLIEKQGEGSNDVTVTRIELNENIPREKLLYDEDIDKNNEEWMRKKRKQQNNKEEQKGKIVSDAMLSCPACMITVCIDCQRHDIYKTQFRAMFVMNCFIVSDQLLHYQYKNKSKKRRKKEGPGKLVEYRPNESEDTATDLQNIETYHPVKCSQCETEIGVFDKDEIYHFFNVIESIA